MASIEKHQSLHTEHMQMALNQERNSVNKKAFTRPQAIGQIKFKNMKRLESKQSPTIIENNRVNIFSDEINRETNFRVVTNGDEEGQDGTKKARGLNIDLLSEGDSLTPLWSHKQFFTSHITKLRGRRLSTAARRRRFSNLNQQLQQ